MTDADSGLNPDRYPLHTVVIIAGRYAGEIVGYGSDDDETYLVARCDGALAMTNRELLETQGVELAWD